VAICKLKQFVADVDLARAEHYLPPCAPPTGKTVAVVGAGPAGLSAAYYLLQQGYGVTVLDDQEEPGGALRYKVEVARLPREVLDGEVGVLRAMGGQFRMKTALGRDVGLEELRRDFAAVVLATGGFDAALAQKMGLKPGARGVHVEKDTHQTSVPGVFAAGGAIRPSKIAIRSVAEGKAAARCVDQFLIGRAVRIDDGLYTTRLPKLSPEDYQTFLTRAGSTEGRTETGGDGRAVVGGFTAEQALREALRCLHCDCAAAEDCKLRRYSAANDADQRRFQGPIARPVTLRIEHPCVVYEPGKCISCGLCVQVAQRHGEPLGLTFIGRGFNVRVGVPFSESMSAGLQRAAAECAAACPTGALVLRTDGKG
jgi:ferredoxin